MMLRGMLAGIAAVAFAVPAQADELHDDLMAQMPQLMELYRDLHANPELSFQEFKTAAKLAARARAMAHTRHSAPTKRLKRSIN